ncbi:MAG: DUF1080 domain-containing protein [Phycisphaerae bacterium]|nr:DUF1080 domain-containing protein [Phycisphaerae bacterium]
MTRSILKRAWVALGVSTALSACIILSGCEKGPAKPESKKPPTDEKAAAQKKAPAKEKAPIAKPEAKKPAAPKPAPKSEAKPKPAPKPAPAPKPEAKPEAKPAAKAETPKPQPQFTKPPAGAKVLFDGKDASGWTTNDGKPFPWKVADGAMVCVPKSGSIRTKETFGDQKLHIEFKPPLEAAAPKGSQGRGNSGVYLQGRYEVQVLDSYDIGRPMDGGDCGALYRLITPSTNVCLPPDQWQSYDITFVAPKIKDGKTTDKGRLTVVQNGITIIDNKEIPGCTPGGIDMDPTKPGPLMLQDHGNTVAYRNIWLVPIK